MDQFSRHGLVFPVLDRGAADGPTIVLLHGFPQDASSYDEVVPALVTAGFRTLVPTQRGYAATVRPSRRHDYRMEELVADVLALVDAAGASDVHLVGHDWGGAVAWGVAGLHPDRVRTLTVLSTPHPAAMTTAMWHSNQALRSWYMAAVQLPFLPEMLLARNMPKTLQDSGLPAAAAARYAASMTGEGALTGALNWYRALPYALRSPVPDISVPTTFVWGTRDFALGRYAAEATRGHVTGDYRFEPLKAGHWLPETRPEQVAAAILDRARSLTG
ncbi:alpha/beta fold hydrolase [Nakamurella sp. GG22]